MTGPITADRSGVTLMHEHVLVDFIGAAEVSRARYDADAVFATVLPHLQQVRALGCRRWSSARPPISAAIRGCCSGCPRRPACTS